MHDEQTLRAKARAAILQGNLPLRAPDRVWAGRGVGAPCPVCGFPVSTDENEFEFEHDGHGRLELFHVHVPCFRAWEDTESLEFVLTDRALNALVEVLGRLAPLDREAWDTLMAEVERRLKGAAAQEIRLPRRVFESMPAVAQNLVARLG